MSPLLGPRGAELASQEAPQSDGCLPAGLDCQDATEKMLPTAHHGPLESVHT